MGVADHQLHAREPALAQAAEEGGPEGLVLTVTHLDPQDLTLAIGRDAHRHDHSPGDHLSTSWISAVQVRRIEVDVRVTAELQRPIQECLHLGVEPLADAAHLRFGDTALTTQRLGPIRSHSEGLVAIAGSRQHNSLSNPLMSCAKAAMPSVIDQIPSSRRALMARLRRVARIWTPLFSP